MLVAAAAGPPVPSNEQYTNDDPILPETVIVVVNGPDPVLNVTDFPVKVVHSVCAVTLGLLIANEPLDTRSAENVPSTPSVRVTGPPPPNAACHAEPVYTSYWLVVEL